MTECPHCGQPASTAAGLKTHLRKAHGILTASDTPDNGPATVTIAFTDRETAVLEQIAKRQNITITAVVRAMVQRVIASGPPKTRTPTATPKPPKRTSYPAQRRPKTRASARAVVLTDPTTGARLCPVCQTRPIVKKNPHGPGRYPNACEQCR